MSDWDDSWYDDDEFPPLRKGRGRGGVIAVAVVTFVMCAFNAFSSTCLLFCGVILGAFGNANNGQFLPGDLVQNAVIMMLFVGLGSLASFIAQIVAGIGLLNSRRWARVLSFYLAGYSVLVCLFLVYLVFRSLSNDIGNAEDNIGQAVMWFIGLGMHGGYAATVYMVLLNPRVASSFR